MKNLEDQFHKIQEDAILEAESVKCELPEFLEGLKVMRSALAQRIEQVEDEVK